MNIRAIFESHSDTPYLIISSLSAALLFLGLVSNSSAIGSFWGAAFAAISPLKNPMYLLAVIGLYFTGRPTLALCSITALSVLHQIYLREFSDDGLIYGDHHVPYLSFSALWGGFFLVSLLGVASHVGKRLRVKNSDS